MYTFEKITHEEFWEKATASYGGEWVYQPGEAGEETYALFFGKMRTLFGAPNEESEDWENMYTYFLKANVPAGTLYSLGVWVPNRDGRVGECRAFVLESLSSAVPLCRDAVLKK